MHNFILIEYYLSIIEKYQIRTSINVRIYLYVLGKGHRIVPLLVPLFIVMDEFDGKSEFVMY